MSRGFEMFIVSAPEVAAAIGPVGIAAPYFILKRVEGLRMLTGMADDGAGRAGRMGAATA